MIPRLWNKPYEKRPNELNSFSLEKRRNFNMFHGFDNVSISDYFIVDQERGTKNNSFKIYGKAFKSEESSISFFSGNVNVWNCLPKQTVSSGTKPD